MFEIGFGVFVVGIFGIAGNIATMLIIGRKNNSCSFCCHLKFNACCDLHRRSRNQENETFTRGGNTSGNANNYINMNDCFYKLLIYLAVIDAALILNIVVEVSVVGIFMKETPMWYKVCL